MTHPYTALEGSPRWDVIDRALAELESNRDLVLTTGRPYVVGYLCQRLGQLGREPLATVTAWRVLRRAGWDLDGDPGAFLAIASDVAGIASAGDETHVALYLAELPRQLGTAIPRSTDNFSALARELVAACTSADEYPGAAI